MPCSCPEARPMWIPRNTKLRQTRRPPRPIPGAMRWTNCCCRMPTTLRKPVLGICYGLQILNVYRHGTLLQHIESAVNHEAGRSVPIAHTVEVDTGTRLSRIVLPQAEAGNDGGNFHRGELESSSVRGGHRRGTAHCGAMSAGWNHRGHRGHVSRSFCSGRAVAPGTFRGR